MKRFYLLYMSVWMLTPGVTLAALLIDLGLLLLTPNNPILICIVLGYLCWPLYHVWRCRKLPMPTAGTLWYDSMPDKPLLWQVERLDGYKVHYHVDELSFASPRTNDLHVFMRYYVPAGTRHAHPNPNA